MSRKIDDGLNKNKRYYRKHGVEKSRERHRKWRAANPENVREFSRRSYWLNREKRLAAKRDYQPIRNKRERGSEIHKLMDLNEKHLRRAAGPGITAEQWNEIKSLFGNRCAYCGKSAALTMDHVVPVTKGGEHGPTNIIPACLPCNSSKGARSKWALILLRAALV
jgi:5-methylcytosine-specific restriction endonuclease McrA